MRRWAGGSGVQMRWNGPKMNRVPWSPEQGTCPVWVWGEIDATRWDYNGTRATHPMSRVIRLNGLTRYNPQSFPRVEHCSNTLEACRETR